MRITGVEPLILRAPLGAARFLSSQSAFPERNSLLVRIETDDGLVGWGEGGQYGPPEPVAACVQAVLAPQILGRDPRQPVRIQELLYALTRDFGQKGAYVEAISAIDIALWDLTGQALGEPVHRLLGGAFRDRVHAYATGCYYRPEHQHDPAGQLPALADEARSYVDAGFDTIKMKVGLLSIADDAARVACVRQAIGPGTRLLADANHAYNGYSALRMGRILEAQDVLWFEEPVVPEDLDGYRLLRSSLDVAIAGGECEFMRYGFRRLFEQGCVDIAQPDLCAAGGLSEWVKIHALASSFGIATIPHVWGSGVALAAALHALAATPPFPYTALPQPLMNEPLVEFDRNPNPLRDELLVTPPRLVEGCLPVPQGPGLGIQVDEDALQRYRQPDLLPG
ncbi:MAG: mandelate racemase/muconate lactonizing enzyme family protein [Anaerolineaceae bacterium]|nr:mandelate racemase/muconate lactonizing enzyme family protein [Anaerolineaceae bacterium]